MEILRFAQDDMNAQDDSSHHGDSERVRCDRGRADRWLELL